MRKNYISIFFSSSKLRIDAALHHADLAPERLIAGDFLLNVLAGMEDGGMRLAKRGAEHLQRFVDHLIARYMAT